MPFKDKQKRNEFERLWRRNHPEVGLRWRRKNQAQNRKIQLENTAMKRYGLTRDQQVSLRAQPCQICGKDAKKMCIDHKEPRSYRGVLCQQCNTRLGWFEKNTAVILEYVTREPRYASSEQEATNRDSYSGTRPAETVFAE